MTSSHNLTIESGVEIEEQSIIWKIKNFHVIATDESLAKTQKIEFTAGDNVGWPLLWTAYLDVDKVEDTKSLRICYRSRESKRITEEPLHSQFSYSIKNKRGRKIQNGESIIRDISAFKKERWGYGFNVFPFPVDVDEHELEDTLEIHITYKVYSTVKPAGGDQLTISRAVEEFQVKAAAKARKDLANLFKASTTAGEGDIKIISSDKQEFLVPKRILVGKDQARSPVFEAMLRSKVREANQGLLELSDITGKTLKLLLHFIHTGSLLPDWKHSGVIVELTNAAAKYQLSDLLTFLDGILGKVCDLETVLPLLRLASQLELKTSEGELLKFIGKKGVGSTKNLFKILEVYAGMD